MKIKINQIYDYLGEKIRISDINTKDQTITFLIYDKKICGKQSYIVTESSFNDFKICLEYKALKLLKDSKKIKDSLEI